MEPQDIVAKIDAEMDQMHEKIQAAYSRMLQLKIAREVIVSLYPDELVNVPKRLSIAERNNGHPSTAAKRNSHLKRKRNEPC